MIKRYTPQLLLLVLVSHLLVDSQTSQATAQSVILLQDDASRCAIFRALIPQVPPECQWRFRSVQLLPLATPAPERSNTTPPAPEPRPASASARPEDVYAFAARIPFAFASAQLTPEAYPLLDTLATVLKDPRMADKVIRIEGHTDAMGSDEVNLVLSARRALAVQRYLRDGHGLAPGRLPVVGKGKSELYEATQPLSAINRRVQFVNVSDSGARR